MSHEKKPLTAQEKTIIRLKRIIFFLSIILIAIGAIYIYNHLFDNSMPFEGRVSDAKAKPKMHNYRRGIHLNRRSMGVYYSVDTIRKYIDSVFPKLIDSQVKYQRTRPGNFNYSEYKWMVGFYWMKKKDTSTEGNANKLDFYVIPTLVHKSKKLCVIDYYSDEDSVYYHGKYTKKRNGQPAEKDDEDEDGNAFDEGQLWP
ncbi:hypothetical protein FAM09_28890 [Niastella caeni]|uniref:Uncharacterized protein n=1 Tax=Niastella caeni TaxID=2569763 RepID=A0A4S8H8T6_9BACT|nr:hypothetical protein [Niastella caeni]THU31103.1 hypothetical protein FAM09_28890 [Niastella caeni]